MTPDEHQLISGLFERMRALGPIDKDRDAESLIMQAVLATPDAAYKLVQSVLVQESALEEAAGRMQAMESRIQQLEAGGQTQAKPASGGFLGGLFGGSKPAPAPVQHASVPASGSRGYGQPQAAGSPWGPPGGQAAGYPPGGYQQGGAYQQQPQRAGGSFMKTAMATAAGVAGGVLVANAIGNMMGGSQARAADGQSADGGTFGASANSGAEANEPQYQDPATNDPGNYEQAPEQQGGQDDGGGGWFGGGGGSDDSEF